MWVVTGCCAELSWVDRMCVVQNWCDVSCDWVLCRTVMSWQDVRCAELVWCELWLGVVQNCHELTGCALCRTGVMRVVTGCCAELSWVDRMCIVRNWCDASCDWVLCRTVMSWQDVHCAELVWCELWLGVVQNCHELTGCALCGTGVMRVVTGCCAELSWVDRMCIVRNWCDVSCDWVLCRTVMSWQDVRCAELVWCELWLGVVQNCHELTGCALCGTGVMRVVTGCCAELSWVDRMCIVRNWCDASCDWVLCRTVMSWQDVRCAELVWCELWLGVVQNCHELTGCALCRTGAVWVVTGCCAELSWVDRMCVVRNWCDASCDWVLCRTVMSWQDVHCAELVWCELWLGVVQNCHELTGCALCGTGVMRVVTGCCAELSWVDRMCIVRNWCDVSCDWVLCRTVMSWQDVRCAELVWCELWLGVVQNCHELTGCALCGTGVMRVVTGCCAELSWVDRMCIVRNWCDASCDWVLCRTVMSWQDVRCAELVWCELWLGVVQNCHELTGCALCRTGAVWVVTGCCAELSWVDRMCVVRNWCDVSCDSAYCAGLENWFLLQKANKDLEIQGEILLEYGIRTSEATGQSHLFVTVIEGRSVMVCQSESTGNTSQPSRGSVWMRLSLAPPKNFFLLFVGHEGEGYGQSGWVYCCLGRRGGMINVLQ